jgi:hypothetical protein
MENYTIHRLEQETFEVLIPLMQDCFGMDVDLSYFKWKYIDNPDGFVRGYYATSENKEVAAYYGVIPQTINFFGETKLIYQSCDTMTHSRHRRKGLFQRLAKHCYTELEKENQLFVIGFGGSESTPGFLKFGWEHLFDCRNYFYPTFFSFLSRTDKKYTIQELSLSKLDQIEHLIKPKENSSVETMRSSEKFAWRLKNPLRNYQILTLSTNKITSYIIYYVDQDKIHLFDYNFCNQLEGRQIIKFLLTKEKRQRVITGILAFCQEGGRWSRLLQKNGFISNPFSKGPLAFRTPFIIFTGSKQLERVKNVHCWNISPFDHDSI